MRPLIEDPAERQRELAQLGLLKEESAKLDARLKNSPIGQLRLPPPDSCGNLAKDLIAWTLYAESLRADMIAFGHVIHGTNRPPLNDLGVL